MTTPTVIEEMIAELNATKRHTTATLLKVLDRDVKLSDVEQWIKFDVANYSRNLIADGGHWEMRLLCWRPGQSTSIHGHGSAIGCIRILRGSAQELQLGQRDRRWAPGSTIIEAGTSLAHQMCNAGPDPLISLHIYSPPLPVDKPSQLQGDSVVIVGGGFAGVATAIHTLKKGTSRTRVTVVERGPWLGRGVAYSQEDRIFRLNVPASRMSIDPDVPDDFVKWSHAEETPHAFLPRAEFGRYVERRLADAVRQYPGKLRIVKGNAASIEPGVVKLADGRHIEGEAIVLASGIEPRVSPTWLATDPRIVDGWDECALPTLPHDGRILILGSGLSAVDIVTMLDHRKFAGHITISSRRGLLPRPHLATHVGAKPLAKELVDDAPRSLRPLIRWVRKVIAEKVASGLTWQEGFDSLRPHLPTLWRRLPPTDRVRFIDHVRPYWEVLRHRLPVDALAMIDKWKARGRLEIRPGKVVSCQPYAEGVEVVIKGKGSDGTPERFDAIVRCIGPALHQTEMQDPLQQWLVDNGLAQADAAGLGIVTDENGLVVDAKGVSQPWLHAIGSVRRASDWETTSVPDIAKHAQAIAKEILKA